MAPRPNWKGYLKLSLVSCPVALFSVKTDRATIRFNLIKPRTGNRIRMLTVDAETDDEVARRDLVKGYEFTKGRYLLLSDDDLNSVKVESSSTMSIEKFVEIGSIDPSTTPAATISPQMVTLAATYTRFSTEPWKRPAASP
jgi:DNA end-binding protein Ku